MPFAQIQITSPSGRKVIITPKEESKFVKKAFEVGLINKINRKDRLRQQLINSSIGAVGAAIGFAVGGVLAGIFLTRILGHSYRAFR